MIPTDAQRERGALVELAVTVIRPNPRQPREHFDEDALAALTASVREIGILQPILVRRVGESEYELIAGERRWRAARRAGLDTLPAIVRDASEGESLQQALIENLNREELNPLEEAAGYQQLIEDFGFTHEQLSTRVGKSRVTITNALRLFQLPPSVQRLVADDRITAGHARTLLGTPDRSFQEALARRAANEQLSVRAVEEAVRRHNQLSEPEESSPPRPPPTRLRPPGVLELEELLAEHLSTKVRVDMGANRGKVIIEFATLEDLERIYKSMTEPG
ncbi:MAG TPA: ParB/RepB/Spo0J family partition protein [Acidimicrobiales bacterium]|nr:ParB/RepB/Spo0J family partition protein [Acidimicrobiales bacterium]